jgi:hypothetical protein
VKIIPHGATRKNVELCAVISGFQNFMDFMDFKISKISKISGFQNFTDFGTQLFCPRIFTNFKIARIFHKIYTIITYNLKPNMRMERIK